jgi:hypothetical protein
MNYWFYCIKNVIYSLIFWLTLLFKNGRMLVRNLLATEDLFFEKWSDLHPVKW